MSWEELKIETKQDLIRNFKLYKKKGFETKKLIKNYIIDVKKIDVHIANDDICNIINY